MQARRLRIALSLTLALSFGVALGPQFRERGAAGSAPRALRAGDAVLLYEYGDELTWTGPHRIEKVLRRGYLLEVGGEVVEVSESLMEPVRR